MLEKRQIFERITELLLKYLEESEQSGTCVVDYKAPRELKEIFDLSIPHTGTTYKEILSSIESYLKYSVRTGHRRYFNQLYAGFSLPSFLGEVITSLTNTSMYTYEVAPLATLMELELIEKMNRLVGFADGTGQFVTGGSNANLLAMLCARNRALPETKTKGLRLAQPLTMFISDQAHYSFSKAANVLGIGADNVTRVKTDHNGRMIPDRLDWDIRNQIKQGKKPFFVTATAGTTVLGAFDSINDVATIAKQYGLWLHVDGAFGGSVLLSRKYRSMLSGSEKADSFTWDPHKMMTTPLICSAILVKDKSLLTENCYSDDTEYLFHDHKNKAYDLGVMSLQCGRRVDAFKLWLSWKYYGNKGYEQRVDKLFELAAYATEVVRKEKHLELVRPTQSVNVCFRYIPVVKTDLNRFNLILRERLMKAGTSLFNYSLIDGNVILRLVFVNPETQKSDIHHLFDTILATGAALSKHNDFANL